MTTNFIPLATLLSDTTYDDSILTTCKGEAKTYAQFRRDVAAKMSDLKSQKRYLLSFDSTYNFAIHLFAVWAVDSVAVMLPNKATKTIEEFATYGEALLTDHEVECDIPTLPFATNSEEALLPTTLESDSLCLEMFTSGTTGKRKKVLKSLANMDSELAILYENFGEQIGSAVTFSTVSHQHIYGLLYKLLLTLCMGRSFVDRSYLFPDELVEDMKECADNAVLISGPAHLKRFPALLDKENLSNICPVVFSSGGLLDAEAAAAFLEHTDVSPIEVLGSTETGGVAWRQQRGGRECERWCTFSTLQIISDEDGFLVVNSPFIYPSEDVPNPFTMGDLIEEDGDNGFYLHGRGDRIVKIEENRVSLEEIENLLKKRSEVSQCRVILVEKSKGSFSKDVLAAFMVLKEGESESPSQEYKEYLSSYLRSVVIPKIWRFLPELPYNAQGKITVEDLEACI